MYMNNKTYEDEAQELIYEVKKWFAKKPSTEEVLEAYQILCEYAPRCRQRFAYASNYKLLRRHFIMRLTDFFCNNGGWHLIPYALAKEIVAKARQDWLAKTTYIADLIWYLYHRHNLSSSSHYFLFTSRHGTYYAPYTFIRMV